MKNLGPYLLLESIAVGGMGEIFLASLQRAGGFEKPVAVKRILPHLATDPAFVEMFEAEARLCALLSHPNIVQIFDFGRSEGQEFMAMELVDGFDLKRLCELCRAADRPLGVALVVHIGLCCARALDYAHRKVGPDGAPLHIIHRDVSPQNVLVSMEGEVKLTDFGLAKTRAVGAGAWSGMLKGKLGYMSPEQVRGQPLDARADLFALGAVLWELLSGRPVYASGQPMARLVAQVSAAEIPSLLDAEPAVPPRLSEIVMRCLAPAPADRWATAAELAEALRGVARHLQATDGAAALAACVRGFASQRRVAFEVAADGTVVSKKPIVALPGGSLTSRQPPAAKAQQSSASATIPARPSVGRPPRDVDRASDLAAPSAVSRVGSERPISARRWTWTVVVVLLVGAAAWSLWPTLPRAHTDRLPARVSVTPSGPSQVAGPVAARRAPAGPAHLPPRRLAQTAAVAVHEAHLTVDGARPGASCLARHLASGVQRLISCGEPAALRPGAWRVVVATPGQPTISRELTLKPGESARVSGAPAVVPAERCALEVTTVPAGATLSVDGVRVSGETPLRLSDLAPGAHALVANRSGYRSQSRSFVCAKGAAPRLEIPLKVARHRISVLGQSRAVAIGRSATWKARRAGVLVAVRATATPRGANLVVSTTPYTQVRLNGAAKGSTPVRFSLPSGAARRVALVRDGEVISRWSVRLGRP